MGSGEPAYRIASRIFARFANFLEPVIVLIYRQISCQNLSVFQTVLGSHYSRWNVCGLRSMRKSVLRFSSHLISSPLTSEALGHHRWHCNNTFPPFPVFRCPQRISKSPSCSIHCPLQNCLRHARGSRIVAIPSEFPFLYSSLQLHSGFCCEPPPRHMVFVGNVQKSHIASHLKSLDPSLDICCQGPALTGIKEGR